MYVCICNTLNDRQIRTAIAAGAGTTAGVYRQCGVRPQCGKCAGEVCRLLREHQPRSVVTASDAA